MSVVIRPYRLGQLREVTADRELLEIVDWPHAFHEHDLRWTDKGTEHPDFAGCTWCGESELSGSHLGGRS